MIEDLERIDPDRLVGDPFSRDVLAIHLERYRFALRRASGARVLDIACGVGYGAALLASADARSVLGVDQDPAAIAHARARYGAVGTEFVEGDAERYESTTPFELVVSLETIEHVVRPDEFVERLASMVAPGGHLIASAPISPSMDVNPFHLHDISERRFRAMFERAGLVVVDELRQVQSVPVTALLLGRELTRPVRRNLVGVYLRSPQLLARRLAWTWRRGFANEYLVLCGRR